MRFIKFALSLLLLLGLIYGLNIPISLSNASLPPLGKFFSPAKGFWQNTAKTPLEDQILDLPDLNGKATVVFDDRGVPHIFADNIEDAMYLQGYLTAKDRLWQMDISTRSTIGRLSEVIGERALERDKLQRRRGMLFAAQNAIKGWSKDEATFNLIKAYSAGVNAYIETLSPEQYPIEFKLMNYEPEEWSPLKTAIFIKSMAQSLCMRHYDIPATNALNLFGREEFDFLYPQQNPQQSPIIPADTPYEFEPLSPEANQPNPLPVDTRMGLVPHRSNPLPPPFLGSNNWAVSSTKTASGNPILCSDPHLQLTLPSVWYEVQIHTPEYNSYGVSLPGVPGIVIGFNENVAWGMTNVGRDVLDWYKIKWVDDSKQQYFLDGKKMNTESVVETFFVKGKDPVKDTVHYTHWGPVVHEKEDHPYQDMAMRWISHDVSPPSEMSVFLNMNRAKNYDDYNEVLQQYVAPAQNFVFASKEGDIAIQPTGKFPLLKKEQGRFIQDGSTIANAWNGFTPMDHLPKSVNPARGFVSSANQHTTAPDYPYYYNGNFDDYRGRILNRKLAKMNKITIEDMMALQYDDYSIEAEELLPILLRELDKEALSKDQKAMLTSLENWDYHFDGDKIAPTIYDVWSDEVYKQIWDEIYAIEDSMDILFPETWRTIALMKEQPNHKYFDHQDTPAKESLTEIVNLSFKNTNATIQNLKEEGKSLKWANHRNTKINHLGNIPAFTSKTIQSGGFHHALNALSRSAGPSWRMIVDLGEEIKAWGVYPGGQSGNPASPLYDNMVDAWSNGEYYEIEFMKDKDDQSEKTTLVWEVE